MARISLRRRGPAGAPVAPPPANPPMQVAPPPPPGAPGLPPAQATQVQPTPTRIQPAPTGVQPIAVQRTQAPGTPGVPPRPTLEGLRAWLSTLDRRVGLRTYIGGALVILALAASAVAIVLAIDARENSADNDDLNAIATQVNELDGATATDFDATSFEARLTAIEDQLSAVDDSTGGGDVANRLDVLENDIEELRGQISDLESGGGNP